MYYSYLSSDALVELINIGEKRDYFAAQAMGSLVTQFYTEVITGDPVHHEYIATSAYRMADAMLKAREDR
ncbi:hypothetical protein KKI96_20645 [Xenorhabdus bovienii]|nr:hypothetical protein [Xenorhabdus bovienii]